MCPNNPKHYYFVKGIKQEIYNIVYNWEKVQAESL